MEIKYPLTKLLVFALGGLMGCVTVAISAYDHRADGESPSFHFYVSLLLAAVNLLLATREARKYARPVILDKEGIRYGKERYFWSSLSSCTLERVEENKLVLSFKETYAKSVSIDLSGYDYDKWNLVRALECFPPSPLFKYEDD